MPDSALLENFHFLRPWWLLLIVVAIYLHRRLGKAFNAARQWDGAIAEHLIGHLIVGAKQRRMLRPYQLMTVVISLAALALAGPAWEREITPFTEDQAPLVVALKLTDSMLAVDQQPTRLARAKQKLSDLLAARQGARTAVIAYAGSAHAVLPLTDDAQLLQIYLESLTPDLMPVAGDAPDKALRLARQMLDAESAAGTIVFMGDGIDRSLADAFQSHASSSADQVLIWAFGTALGGPIVESSLDAPPYDLDGMNIVANASGSSVIRSSVDDSDLRQITGDIRTHLVNAIEADEDLRWIDAGYFLVWPLALLALVWSRRGWTVAWS